MKSNKFEKLRDSNFGFLKAMKSRANEPQGEEWFMYEKNHQQIILQPVEDTENLITRCGIKLDGDSCLLVPPKKLKELNEGS